MSDKTWKWAAYPKGDQLQTWWVGYEDHGLLTIKIERVRNEFLARKIAELLTEGNVPPSGVIVNSKDITHEQNESHA